MLENSIVSFSLDNQNSRKPNQMKNILRFFKKLLKAPNWNDSKYDMGWPWRNLTSCKQHSKFVSKSQNAWKDYQRSPNYKTPSYTKLSISQDHPLLNKMSFVGIQLRRIHHTKRLAFRWASLFQLNEYFQQWCFDPLRVNNSKAICHQHPPTKQYDSTKHNTSRLILLLSPQSPPPFSCLSTLTLI